MAGKNLTLKPDQILFKAGDASDGMYVVRSGDLRVYLEQDDTEVALATVSAGGMIGEMALFDKKPRSASVKAVSAVEVTQITNEDFAKLMKQIPKWFVSLMGTLSTRLRQTNDRLQKLETGSDGKPFRQTLRILHVLNLLWHKDGVKEGKSWQIEKKNVLDTLSVMFGEDEEKLEDLFKVLVNESLMACQTNSYKTLVLSVSNKAVLRQFIEFLEDFLDKESGLDHLAEPGLQILGCLSKAGESSAYDQYTVPLPDLEVVGKKLAYDTDQWKDQLPIMKNLHEAITLVKTSTGDLGFRTEKKAIETVNRFHRVIAALHKANLAK